MSEDENLSAPSGPLSDEPREHENQDVAAPSVGELEWQRLEDLDGKPNVMFVANAPHAPLSTWQIARGLSDEWCLFPPNTDWNVEQTVLAVGSSVRKLQSLANSLQRILSGAAE
jgi:hypothetical protein